MTTKNKFFNNLHDKLGKKYKIHPYSVKMIRCMVIGEKLSLVKVLEKMSKFISKKKARVGIYRNALDFITIANKEQIEDILQKTKFDK